ncbi:unnamed protein product [Symbiodinium necroappetens]|uniref:WW domain-containing protein n=1 Tax=Symbiodinium necroappetens TaxID=1628268 RepID=A0A812ZY86_9DINO|nr:unnamed protein product [Symbiodinium necroappetens]
MDGTDCGKHDDKLKHRVLTLPSLRGGLLVHALKKIKKRTGVLTCELRYLDYGAEVVINGKPGSVLNCEEAVLQVAEGSIDGLGFAEVRHEVSFPAAKKLDTGKAKLHRSPAQAIGCMTGCDLILDEAQSQMLVVGPSEADSEERAWKPPAKAPPQFLSLAQSSDRPISPVVQAVTDEFGRRYYWNHMDATSSWHPPPPHIGFWEHLLDYRTGRAYFVNRGTGQTSWDLLGRLHPGAEAKAKLSAPSPSAWVPPSTPPAPPSTVPTEAPSSACVASVSVAKSTDGQIEGRREARLRTRQALEEIKARRRRSPGPPGPSSSVPDYEAAEEFLELPAGGGAENQAEDRNDDDVEADAEPGELVYNEEEEDVFITEGAEGTQTHPETFVEEGDPGRSSQTDQQDMSDEVLVDLDPIPDDGQAFWEQDMSMEFDLANKDDTFESDVFEQEDLDDFADEEAIKHELLSEIQTFRERQEEEVHPEGDIVWQVDEEELHDMEHEQVRPAEGHGPGEPGEPEAEPGVIRPPMQPKSKHKAKPTPPSEPPPNWHNGTESSQNRADLHDDAGTQWAPWRSQKAGGKRQQAKGTWTEQKTKRKVEYAGNSPPALRRKSWSTDNWAGHEGRGSEWGDSSWDGPSHQRGYRHAKPMDKDWSQDWKAWKDESTWQRGSSSSSNRGWSWKRR